MSRMSDPSNDSSATLPPSGSVRLRRRIRNGQGAGQLRRRLVSYALIAVAIALMVNAVVGENGYLAKLRARQQYEELSSEVLKLRLENQQLKEQARRLKEDPSAVEEAARRDLGLIRPGETLIVVREAGQ
jgi:cell division protein FtsB